jgi:hypothetical protein
VKKLFPFVTIGIAFFILSFEPYPVFHSLINQKKASSTGNPLNPTLYPLYIENSANNPQLDALIELGTRSWIAGNFRKIIFQFVYQNQDSGFTLVAFGGRRKQRGIDSTKIVQFLSYITPCVPPPAKVYNISRHVYLGDLELFEQKKVMKTLNDYKKHKGDHPYIIFYPKLDTSIYNNITRINVKYEIYSVTSLSDICSIGTGVSLMSTTQANASTNPSPPRNGN